MRGHEKTEGGPWTGHTEMPNQPRAIPQVPTSIPGKCSWAQTTMLKTQLPRPMRAFQRYLQMSWRMLPTLHSGNRPAARQRERPECERGCTERFWALAGSIAWRSCTLRAGSRHRSSARIPPLFGRRPLRCVPANALTPGRIATQHDADGWHPHSRSTYGVRSGPQRE